MALKNFKYRKLNNLKVNPNPTHDYYLHLVKKRNPECINRLSKLNLANEIHVNYHGVESEFKCNETVFHPSRHITPTNPNGHINM